MNDDELQQVRAHLNRCPSCLRLVKETLPADESSWVLSPPARGPSAPPRWRPTTTFDCFEGVTLEGKGGMGEVYRAYDVRLCRLVALKFIAAQDPDDELRARFLREARAAARLSHPNIASAYRAADLDGHAYLVSEWVDGQRLDQEPRPVPWERVLTLGLGIARGLAHAHHKGILHRDIKPANIIVQREDGEPKLLDFGLAKLLPSEGEASRAPSTQQGARMGTPRYMSPEVDRGEPATAASDVYSLGLVLYELCTDQLPDRAACRSLAGPPLLIKRAPQVSPALAAIIDRCLRGDATQRFPSAQPLAEALERLADAGPTAAPTFNPYRGLSPFEAEHRALFFGRGAEIRSVIERLRSEPLMLLAGDSGVGKSSLCAAGLVPRVQEGDLADGREYTALRLVPGRAPLRALCAALARLVHMNAEALLAWTRGDCTAPRCALLDKLPASAGLLLFIDQAEEVVTLSDPAEVAVLAQVLRDLARHAPPVRTVLAVRTDFLSRLTSHLEGLDESGQRSVYFVRPLSRAAVHDTITGPALRLGVHIDAAVVQQAEAVARDPGGLPLLQFALAELWQTRDSTTAQITAQQLEELGGLAGALSRHADRVVYALPAAQQRLARRLLLLSVSEAGTRIRRSEEELVGGEELTRVVLHALVAGRLLVAGEQEGRPTYELAHEVLIQCWPLLRGVLDTDVGERAARNRLQTAAKEWARLGRDKAALWQERQVDETLALDPRALPQAEAEFLTHSRRRVHSQRRLRPWLRFLASGAVMIAATYTFQAYRAAASQVHHERTELERIASEPSAERREQDLKLRALNFQYSIANTPLLHGLFRAQLADHARKHLREYLRLHPGKVEDWRRTPEHEGLASLLRLEAPREVNFLFRHGTALRAQLQQIKTHADAPEPGAPTPLPFSGGSDIATAALRAGSWLLRVTTSEGEEVAFPFVLDSIEADGARRDPRVRIEVPLPRRRTPQGFVFIPAGRFLHGSDEPEAVRKSMDAAPLTQGETDSFLIGRYEVTFTEWLAFLNDRWAKLDAAAREREIPPLLPCAANPTAGLGVALAPLDSPWWPPTEQSTPFCPPTLPAQDKQAEHPRWGFGFRAVGHGGLVPITEQEPLRYEGRAARSTQDWRKLPVVGISPAAAARYLQWLAQRGGVRARACSELEWERAARGADWRPLPMGFKPDDAHRHANIDVTYQRKGFGLDEVDAHPGSVSPFGVHGMLGNAFELVPSGQRSESGGFLLRGGSWYHDVFTGWIALRMPADENFRRNDAGFRVCADAP